jgi:endonuclease YncB( thermonuclease family)
LVAILGIAACLEIASRFDVRNSSVGSVAPWVLGTVAFARTVSPETVGETLQGRVVKIADGDTLTLLVDRTEHRIRLSEIDTPERGQDWSRRARQALSEKVGGEHVLVVVETVDRYGRSVGKIWLDGRDINREMVSEGYAWVYRKYLRDRTLLEDEAGARNAAYGLWADPDPVPPWEWRRGTR